MRGGSMLNCACRTPAAGRLAPAATSRASGTDGRIGRRHDLVRAPGRTDRYGRAGEIPRGAAAGLQGADHGREDADRPVEPDVPARLAQRPLRAAQEAAGPAAEERARGRPRVPRHEGAGGHRRAGAAHAASCARTTASSAPPSSSWSSSTAPCSGTRRCPSWSKAQRTKVYDEENRALAALHLGRSRPRSGLADFGKAGSYFARQRDRWTKQYRASETEHLEDMETLITWLEENEPPDDGRVQPGARRLPPRQHDLQAGRLAPARRHRLGALHHRPPVLRPRLPVHAVALPQPRDHARPRRRRPHGARHPDRGGVRRQVLRAHRASPAFPPGSSASPSPSSASPPSCRASRSAGSTATPPTRRRPSSRASACP